MMSAVNRLRIALCEMEVKPLPECVTTIRTCCVHASSLLFVISTTLHDYSWLSLQYTNTLNRAQVLLSVTKLSIRIC